MTLQDLHSAAIRHVLGVQTLLRRLTLILTPMLTLIALLLYELCKKSLQMLPESVSSRRGGGKVIVRDNL